MRTHLSFSGLSLLGVVLCFGLLVWLDQAPAQAQTAPNQLLQLTKEQGTPVGGDPVGFTPFNDALYFGLRSERRGLWRTDGTASGTVLVTDLQVIPTTIQTINGVLYFATGDLDRLSGKTNGFGALWQSDGTAGGTVLLYEGIDVISDQFVVLDGMIYFAARDAMYGAELWRTDGTPVGTARVTDGRPGSADTYRTALRVEGPYLYFIGYDEYYNDFRLWQSDGTAGGTRLVEPGPGRIGEMFVYQDQLYMSATNWERGMELWRYDGSIAGPVLVKDIDEQYVSVPSSFTEFQELLYFSASVWPNPTSLWRTDGTDDGTHLVKETGRIENMVTIGDRLFMLVVIEENVRELWVSDGTPEGTQLLGTMGDPIPPIAYISHTAVLQGQFIFSVYANNQTQLWKSDGTVEGTTDFAELPLSTKLTESPFGVFKDTLFMSVSDGAHGAELWTSDGTTAGTQFLKELDPNHRGQVFGDVAVVGQRFYATAALEGDNSFHGPAQLWMASDPAAAAAKIGEPIENIRLATAGDFLLIEEYDTTTGVTRLLSHGGDTSAPLEVGTFPALYLQNALSISGQAYFLAARNGDALWRSDGTITGTVPVSVPTSLPPYPVRFGDQVVTARGASLWLTDGTSNGTKELQIPDLRESIVKLLPTAKLVYFATASSLDPSKNNWWRSDGTVQGTYPLTPQVPGFIGQDAVQVGDASYVTVVGDALYFYEAYEGKRTIWYTSGNSAAIVRLAQFGPTGDSQAPPDYGAPVAGDGRIYFVLDDGIRGPELWTSDSTTGGTRLVKDIVPSTLDGRFELNPTSLFVFDNLLYFCVTDGEHGRELWRSDGTADGTFLLKDINPGPGDSVPTNFIDGGAYFYFTADDGVHGPELWQSDGTADGTLRVTDLYPGIPGSHPAPYAATDTALYFTADNGRDGHQFYQLYMGQKSILPYQLYLPQVGR